MTATVLTGDVIQVNGPSVPEDLHDKYFIVADTSTGAIDLSAPYWDRACTRPYVPGQKVKGVLIRKIAWRVR